MSLSVVLLLLLTWCPSPLAGQTPPLGTLEASASEPPGERLASLMELMEAHLKTDVSKVLVHGKEALTLLAGQPNSARLLRVLSALCYASYRRDFHQEALEYGVQAEELARTLDDRPALAFVLTHLGNSARRLGQHYQGLAFSLEAIGLYESLGDQNGAGNAANGVGYAYWRLGEYSKALTFYLRAQEDFSAVGNERGVAKTLSNIGTLYLEVRQPQRALELYQEALVSQQATGNERGIGRLEADIGHAYYYLGDSVNAKEHLLTALEICRRLGDRTGTALALSQMGDALRGLGELEQAMENYQQALEIRRQIGDRKRQAHTLIRIGAAEIERGQHQLALERIHDGLAIASEIQAKGEVLDAYEEMANAYASLNRFREAFEASRTRDLIEGELFNEKISRDFEEILSRFVTDRDEPGQAPHQLLDLKEEVSGFGRLSWMVLLAGLGLLALFMFARTRFSLGIARREERRQESQAKQVNSAKSIEVEEPGSGAGEVTREGGPPKHDTLQRPVSAPYSGKGGSFVLRWQSKTPVSSSFPLSAGENRIGRDPGNDIVLPLPQISREHGCLVVEGNNFELVDLSSTNGTEINGKMVQRSPLRLGDILCLGSTELLRLELIDPQDAVLGLVLDEAVSPNGSPISNQRAEEVTSTTIARPLADTLDGLVFPEHWVPGRSAVMHQLYLEMHQVLDADLTVLIEGETGVGKEGVARVLHLSSSRRGQPFVAVNCAAIPGELLEAEMFGIGKGVATGVSRRSGRFLAAEGGTLFLDEIGEMPLELQAKLLRAVQEKRIQPVGSAEVPVDAWVIAATNQDLLQLSDDGKFRRDLYYRLAGSVLKVPPLRDRPDDVVLLLDHFLRRGTEDDNSRIRGVTAKVLSLFKSYSWPGNVRELEHEVRRLAHLSENGQIIDSAMLSERLLDLEGRASGQRLHDETPSVETTVENSDPRVAETPPFRRDGERVGKAPSWRLKDHVQEIERQVIFGALQEVGSSQRQAAELLGISRSTLARKIADLDIQL